MTSWLAFLLNMTGVVLLRKKNPIGWLFGIASELLWIQVAVKTEIYALALMGGVYIVMAGWSYFEWRRDESSVCK
jgi:nicotinamide riboside transporter PnuC